jgi:hypothetical protein
MNAEVNLSQFLFLLSCLAGEDATSLPNATQVTLSCLTTEVPLLTDGMVLHNFF